MIEAFLRINEKSKLKRVIDDSVEKKDLNLYNESVDEALTGTYIEIYNKPSSSPPPI